MLPPFYPELGENFRHDGKKFITHASHGVFAYVCVASRDSSVGKLSPLVLSKFSATLASQGRRNLGPSKPNENFDVLDCDQLP